MKYSHSQTILHPTSIYLKFEFVEKGSQIYREILFDPFNKLIHHEI